MLYLTPYLHEASVGRVLPFKRLGLGRRDRKTRKATLPCSAGVVAHGGGASGEEQTKYKAMVCV